MLHDAVKLGVGLGRLGRLKDGPDDCAEALGQLLTDAQTRLSARLALAVRTRPARGVFLLPLCYPIPWHEQEQGGMSRFGLSEGKPRKPCVVGQISIDRHEVGWLS